MIKELRQGTPSEKVRVNMARSRENMEAGVAGGWALKREMGQKLGQRGKLADRDNQSRLIDPYKDTGFDSEWDGKATAWSEQRNDMIWLTF